MDDLSQARIPLNSGAVVPALGFGTLIPDPAVTRSAVTTALQVGFRHLDCAERYRNEREVGEAIRTALSAGVLRRQDLFVTTKLWNNNHRPERVAPALRASLQRLGWITSTCTSFTRPLPSSLVTSRNLVMPRASSSMTTGSR